MKSDSIKKIEPVSKMYARALFDLAVEKNDLKTMEQELPEAVGFFWNNEDLKTLFSSRSLSVSEKKAVLEDVSKKTELKPFLKNFFTLLIEKGRFAQIQEIAMAFQNLVDKKAGVIRGTVTSTESLSDSQKSDLASAFSKKLGKTVLLEQKTDKTILGGLVVQIQGKVFDGSLKTTIQRLKENLERQSL